LLAATTGTPQHSDLPSTFCLVRAGVIGDSFLRNLYGQQGKSYNLLISYDLHFSKRPQKMRPGRIIIMDGLMLGIFFAFLLVSFFLIKWLDKLRNLQK
jgi:hypothetical protein